MYLQIFIKVLTHAFVGWGLESPKSLEQAGRLETHAKLDISVLSLNPIGQASRLQT